VADKRLDVLASELQFVDHLAPVWKALPEELRGVFRVPVNLEAYAESLGLEVEAIPWTWLRAVPAPPASPPKGERVLVASYGDTRNGRRLGYGEFAFLEHGCGQSYGAKGDRHPSYSGGTDRDDTTLFMVPGPHPARRWRQFYPGAKVVEVGCPKLDSLPRKNHGPTTVAFAFHCPFAVVPELYETLSYYAPVLRDAADRFKTIGHAHPRAGWPRQVADRFKRARIPFVESLSEVFERADLLVCDNSSIIYEFASTGRPVLLLNAPCYRRGVEHGIRFWAASDVGLQVDRPEQLCDKIAQALDDKHESRREAALRLVYTHRTGAAQLAAEALSEWMAGWRVPEIRGKYDLAQTERILSSTGSTIVTSFGRKLRIDPRGSIEVLTGPPLR